MQKAFLYIGLGTLSLLLLISLNSNQRRHAAAELALTEATRAAVAEAASELDALIVQLDKLMVTTSARQMASLASGIALHTERVQLALAELPDTQGQQAAVMAFLSSLSTQAQSLLTELAAGEGLSSAQRTSLTGMQSGLHLLQAELTLARQDALAGMELTAAMPPSELDALPSALEIAEYKALPSREVGSGEAMQIAKDFVGPEQVLSVAHAPDTAGALPAYGITVQTPDVQLNLEITRQGGKVLLMVPESASFAMRQTPQACGQAALEFLRSRGFAQMEIPYYQVYDGLCVLTCVGVQNGVLIWPDRVLVQVRMDTGEVVGIEARSYWKNHLPRKLQRPLLTQEEAQASLSPQAAVDDARLCLLPSGGQERLCWQFTLHFGDDQYISYIDAITGSELLLEKIMQLEMGQIAA